MATNAPSSGEHAAPNGHPAGQATGDASARAAASEEYQAALQRAEELLDQAAERVGPYALEAQRQLRRWAARVREEAEDLWAEAQHIREQRRS